LGIFGIENVLSPPLRLAGVERLEGEFQNQEFVGLGVGQTGLLGFGSISCKNDEASI
jgi:hypothetical protein